jgi:flagellar protein FliS
MNPNGAQNYFRMRVMTATPEQLQMMLFDGALRFGEQAKLALAAKTFDESHRLITRVQNIVTEMASSLKHDVNPELCGKLAGLYNYVYRKLIDANIRHDAAALDEAIDLLKFQRETWTMLMEKLGKQKAAAAANQINMPGPDQRMEQRIAMTG